MAFRQIYLTTNKESIYLLPNTIAPICPLLFTQYSENSRAGWITEQSKQLPQRYPSFEQPWVQNTVTGKVLFRTLYIHHVKTSSYHNWKFKLVEVGDAKVDGGFLEPILQELRLMWYFVFQHLPIGTEISMIWMNVMM